jgi:hypothetical protein
MRHELTWLDAAMVAAIGVVAAVNLFLYTLILQPAAVALGGASADLPDGNAPIVNERRAAAEEAEQDDSDGLPGRFVPNQGRSHVSQGERVEYCRDAPLTNACYSTVPPTSGLHLGVQRNVRLASADVVNIPPDPAIYDFEIPREAIPHLQEHAGVFLGYNCASDDCRATVNRIERLVEEELALGARVVMAPLSDLDPDAIALASWTRLDSFTAAGYSDQRVRSFIKAHSCRFDPEGFCPDRPVN